MIMSHWLLYTSIHIVKKNRLNNRSYVVITKFDLSNSRPHIMMYVRSWKNGMYIYATVKIIQINSTFKPTCKHTLTQFLHNKYLYI